MDDLQIRERLETRLHEIRDQRVVLAAALEDAVIRVRKAQGEKTVAARAEEAGMHEIEAVRRQLADLDHWERQHAKDIEDLDRVSKTALSLETALSAAATKGGSKKKSQTE